MPSTCALFALCLLASPTSALATDAGVEPASHATGEDEAPGQTVLLQLKLQRNGKTLKHPGHMAETGEESILVLKVGDRTHEVAVLLEKSGEAFTAEVAYTDNGKKVLEGKKKAAAKAWIAFKSNDGKTVVSIRVDPDAKRPDEVEVPDGNNPLDGV